MICRHLALMGSSEYSDLHADKSKEHLLDVMARVAARDRAALAELYQLTSAKLFGITLRICVDRTAAEDVLQEVFIKVWHSASQFQAGTYSPISWLSVIARNASIDWLRKYGRQENISDTVIEIIADDAPLGDVAIEQMQQKAQIMYCLEQLDANQNEPIRSAFFGGFTYADLAAKERVPLSTIKSRVRRGLMKLKKCLEDG